MSIHRRDILFYGGGAALKKYGRLSRCTASISRRGEDVVETFTRAGTAYYIDGNGVLRLAAANVPRINHWGDGAILSTPRVVLEDERTNAWTYGEQFDNAAWTKTNCSVSANATTAPDGTATMDHIVEDGTASAGHEISRTTPTLTDDTDQAVSCFAKAGTRTWLCIRTRDKAGNYDPTWINLATGVVGTVDANHSVVVEELGGGIFRINVVWNCGSGATAPLVQFRLATQDGELTYTGNGTSGLYLWGVQYETDQPCCSSYIKTEGAAATREVEELSFPLWTPPRAMSIYTKLHEVGGYLMGSSGRLWNISSSTAPRMGCYGNTGGWYYANHYTDLGNVGSTSPTNVIAVGDDVEVLVDMDETGALLLTQAVNGDAGYCGARGSPLAFAEAWSLKELRVGRMSSTTHGINELYAWIIARGSHSLADFRAILP